MDSAADTPQALAEACARLICRDDLAARALGIVLDHVAPGEATLSMQLTREMTNAHGTGHGGVIFLLADTAFAIACNSYNRRTVAQHCSITYLAPAREGDRLTAIAREHVRIGRSGIYDIRVVDQDGRHVAEFRGHSRTIQGENLPGDA